MRAARRVRRGDRGKRAVVTPEPRPRSYPMFLLITRVAAGLRLSRREEMQKTAEILILRHQLAILQRRQPRRPNLNWADGALIAALPGVMPREAAPWIAAAGYPGRDRGLAPRRRPPPPGRQVHARQDRPPGHPPEHQGPWSSGWLARIPAGGTEGSMASWPDQESKPQRRPSGRSSGPAAPASRGGGPGRPGHKFLRSRAGAILASDFFTAGLPGGTQACVLAVTGHASRRIRVLGVTQRPAGEQTTQQARNLIMDPGEQAHRVKFIIRDRGPDFTAASGAVLAGASIRTVPCNVATPRMNAITVPWIGGCRREVLDRTLIWNQAHLRQILRDYETHHTQHRPHRSLHSAAPLKPLPEPAGPGQCRVRKQARAGGLIGEYRLVA